MAHLLFIRPRKCLFRLVWTYVAVCLDLIIHTKNFQQSSKVQPSSCKKGPCANCGKHSCAKEQKNGIKPAKRNWITPIFWGFIMSDNNCLNLEWRMLICTGAGAREDCGRITRLRGGVQVFWNRQYADEMSNSVRMSHQHDISITAGSGALWGAGSPLTALSQTFSSHKSIFSLRNCAQTVMTNKKPLRGQSYVNATCTYESPSDGS